MTKKRSEQKIIQEILKRCLEKTRFTRIMYSCNLSFTMAKRYLQKLIDLDLLGTFPFKDTKHKFYLTTKQGKAWLDAVELIKEIEGGEKTHEEK